MSEIVANIIDLYPFRRNGDAIEFLLLKRAPDSVVGNTWQSVHGKIETGETAPQTALRELHEETGLRPLRFWQLEYVNTFYVARIDRILMCPCFAAEIAPDATVTLSIEHTDYRWESPERAIDIFMWPGQRRSVREVLEHIVTPSPAEPHLRVPMPD